VKSSDRQYIHRSGAAFVRVATSGFAWVHNRLKLKEGFTDLQVKNWK
jgi:hypothetical protein